MEEFFNLIGREGVVVVSFAYLLRYTLTSSQERETKLMDFMNTLKDEIKNLRQDTNKISSDINDLKNEIKNTRKED